ncbi:hypothetical protein V5085_10655 [Moellerella wisconsensis]|uniref:hypothetical protein n=1 Tax=Moellerella wisconsensis TaxID=158849 RepID=UPI0030762348
MNNIVKKFEKAIIACFNDAKVTVVFPFNDKIRRSKNLDFELSHQTSSELIAVADERGVKLSVDDIVHLVNCQISRVSSIHQNVEIEDVEIKLRDGSTKLTRTLRTPSMTLSNYDRSHIRILSGA